MAEAPIRLVTRTEEAAEDVVLRLEQALEMARSGHLSGVAVAYVTNDGAVGTGFSRCEKGGALMGACALLLHRVCND